MRWRWVPACRCRRVRACRPRGYGGAARAAQLAGWVLAGRGCWLAGPVEAGGQVHDAGLMDSGTGDGRVLGVDACRRGWIGLAVEGTVTGAYFAEDIQALIARAQADGPLCVVAVDMPIGLADRGQRQADMLARAEIGRCGPRSS
jgi:hypothetical protein